ncbi:hypothetical protein ACN28S_56910 [Cystobacter fuscus]
MAISPGSASSSAAVASSSSESQLAMSPTASRTALPGESGELGGGGSGVCL